MVEGDASGTLVERHRRLPTGPRPPAVSCAGCGAQVPVRGRGPLPRWCSSTCRHRAWEQRRAVSELQAAGSLMVVRETVETPVVIEPERSEWVGVLARLTRQIASHELPDGCLVPVYEALTVAINQAALRDREHRSGQIRGLRPHPALPGRERVIEDQVDTETPHGGLARARQTAAIERAARRYDARMRRRFPTS